MSAFSNYLENQIIGWAFSGATFATLPTSGTVWVSLHTSDPSETGAGEVTGGNYVRIAVTSTGWTKNLSNPASATNANEISFPASGTVTWSATTGSGVTHVGIWDAASTGNFLFGGALTTAKIVNVGDVFKFTANNLTITVA
jgi:hypothetical protein